MKKRILSIVCVLALLGALGGCAQAPASTPAAPSAPESAASASSQPASEPEAPAAALPRPTITSPEEAIAHLKAGNEMFQAAVTNQGDISPEVRADNATNGQHPYAVIITCSDSRVPPEHIFLAGVGDLFVIRTAGNVVDDFELGSIEYGAEHLHAKVVVVMGHSHCGAVGAAIDGHADGHIQNIVDEIKLGIGDEQDSDAAERLNITQSKNRIMESEIITHMVEAGELQVVEAKYDIDTGLVTFFETEAGDLPAENEAA